MLSLQTEASSLASTYTSVIPLSSKELRTSKGIFRIRPLMSITVLQYKETHPVCREVMRSVLE